MDHVPEPETDSEISLLDSLLILLKHSKMIVWFTFGVAVLTAIVSLIMSPIYQSTARILPPQQPESSGLALLGRLGGGGFGDLLSMSLGGTADVYVGILKGDTISDAIIDRFNLMDLYEAEMREDARLALAKLVRLESEKKSGIITIKVQDKSPEKAAEMANAFVEELSRLLQNIAVTSASKKRLFFEEQLKLAHVTLANSEEALSAFQERTGAIKIDEQAKAVLEGIARLQATVAAKEVELKVLKTYATPQNRDVRRIEEELIGLQEQLKKLERQGGETLGNSIIPTGQIPLLGTEYLRKMREFKFQEALYEILIKQFETARLSEAQDSAMIQVVDSATVPQRRFKPKRTLMVLVATFFAFFLAVIGAFVVEYLNQFSNQPDNREKMEKIKEYISLAGVKRLFSTKST